MKFRSSFKFPVLTSSLSSMIRPIVRLDCQTAFISNVFSGCVFSPPFATHTRPLMLGASILEIRKRRHKTRVPRAMFSQRAAFSREKKHFPLGESLRALQRVKMIHGAPYQFLYFTDVALMKRNLFAARLPRKCKLRRWQLDGKL